jgi:hypothetical protein
MALSDQVQNSLDETRMLILGAQVLVGFEYQGVFMPGFDRLPLPLPTLKLVSLTLMTAAVGLLIAPSSFHQIVERGNDTRRVVRYTSRIAAMALLPFALGMGINAYVVGQLVVGQAAAVVVALVITGFALTAWYGIEWWIRLKHRPAREKSMSDEHGQTNLETKIKLVLTEARVVLPGAQALLGFQFTAMLTDQFPKLPRESQLVHLGSLVAIAASIVLLMAPAAFHRIVERGEDTERVRDFSSVTMLWAMVPLALGIAGDFYVVVSKILDSTTIGVVLAGACLVFFYGLWFGLSFAVRARDERSGRLASAKLAKASR